MTYYAVMSVLHFKDAVCGPWPVATEKGNPTSYIPVFENIEDAIEWAHPYFEIVEIRSTDRTNG